MKNLMIIYEVMKPCINGKWEEPFWDDFRELCNRYHTSIVGKKCFKIRSIGTLNYVQSNYSIYHDFS